MTHITIYTSIMKKIPDIPDNVDKLYPKCHPYWMIDGKRVENRDVKPVAYTAQGYMLPCCWCDHAYTRKEYFHNIGMFDEALKVENVDDIKEEILQSPEWYRFHETLLQKPNNAPYICKRKCSKP